MPVDPAQATAIVPLRTGGKTRLAPVLGTQQRAALAGAMLADVARALRGARVGRVIVAAEGPAAVSAAEAVDLEVVRDEPGDGGLDGALAHAARRVPPDTALLIVAADLPRLRPRDIGSLLAATTAVGIAPTGDGGTGGLVRLPADIMPTAYGPDSARRHRRLAERAGAPTEVVRTPGFEHDVDTIDDLAALRGPGVGPATAEVLRHFDRDGRAAS